MVAAVDEVAAALVAAAEVVPAAVAGCRGRRPPQVARPRLVVVQGPAAVRGREGSVAPAEELAAARDPEAALVEAVVAHAPGELQAVERAVVLQDLHPDRGREPLILAAADREALAGRSWIVSGLAAGNESVACGTRRRCRRPTRVAWPGRVALEAQAAWVACRPRWCWPPRRRRRH